MSLKFIIPFFFMIVNAAGHASCIGINCTCTTTANTVAFGSYNPVSGTALTATGNVAVTCSALVAGLNVSYVIALNAGQNGSFSARKMAMGSSLLQYNLYTSSTYTSVWGDGASGTSTVSDSYLLSLLSVTRNYAVYGSMPVSQNVVPGTSYADTITVTVTY
ncbi:MAG: spore coat U domain-containing protein [Legionella sp.]|uniref:Csu type fimbrial protein n=1 Tax=Legionella sp. TaxID=459 RepID=UPI00285155EE|nr:spore coat U domain-containing protein [Legionella sp.]